MPLAAQGRERHETNAQWRGDVGLSGSLNLVILGREVQAMVEEFDEEED